MIQRILISIFLLSVSLLMGADAPVAKPLSDADKLRVSKQMNQVLALNGQLAQIAEQYQKAQSQAQTLQTNFQALIGELRKKYGAKEEQQVNLDLEWTPVLEKPPEAAKK
jgi:hypothetical protein